MKRRPLKQSTPLERRKGLERRQGLRAKVPPPTPGQRRRINPVSTKKAASQRELATLVRKVLIPRSDPDWRQGQCEIVVDGVRCPERSHLDPHHKLRQGQGGAHTPDNVILVCRRHHDWIHFSIPRAVAYSQDWLRPGHQKGER